MRLQRVASWIVALALAAMLAFMVGLPKLIGSSANPIFWIIAQRSGFSFFEPYLRYLTGLGEMLAALMLVWPDSRRLGAALAALIVAAALAFHFSPWLGVEVPNLNALSALLSRGANPAQIAAAHIPGDGGALFATAVALFTASVALLWLERPRTRAR